jgi:hypothetical protein
MKSYTVIALSVVSGSMIFNSGDQVNENQFPEGHAESLVKQGFLKPVDASEADLKAEQEAKAKLEAEEKAKKEAEDARLLKELEEQEAAEKAEKERKEADLKAEQEATQTQSNNKKK